MKSICHLTKENLINKSHNIDDKKKKILILNLENDKNKTKILESEKKKEINLSNNDITNKQIEKLISNNNLNNSKIIENTFLNQNEKENEKQIKKKICRREIQNNKKININNKDSIKIKIKNNNTTRESIQEKTNLFKSQTIKKLSKPDSKKQNYSFQDKIIKTSTLKSIEITNRKNSNIKLKQKKFQIKKLNNEKDDELKKKLTKIFLLPPIKIQEISIKLTYCIYKGNNDKLIEKCFEYRKEIWQKSDYYLSKYCDFLWTPLSKDIDFQMAIEKKQYVNHIENHIEITNKKNLFLTLLKHCENKHYNLFSFFPFTIIFEFKNKTLETQLHQFKYIYDNIESYVYDINNDMLYHKYNEIFYTYQSSKLGSDQRIFFPKTHYEGYNLWVIKAVNLNRGMGIKIENDLEKIEKEINSINNNLKMEISEKRKRKCKCIIIQKYIEKPLLYQGRKFDIRLWVLYIGNKPDNIYIFKEGHLKATCGNYDLNSNDLYIHLTNYSIQKYNSDFSKIEIGNEISFKDFQKDLDLRKIKIDFRKNIYPKIVRIVRITAGAAKPKFNMMKTKNCFEIFGYDFMIDEKFNPFLIEINTNPGFEISSPLIDMLLPRLIDDAFKLTIDSHFSDSNIFINIPSKFHVEGYSNYENMFEEYSVL